MIRGSDPEPDAADLEIRPISPADRAALQAGFDRLSRESRYRRFLAARRGLSKAELRYLTEVDHHDHEALVAFDRRTGEGVGVARYVRSAEHPESAELAVAVVDDWQGRGVGSRLAGELAERAQQEGITVFTAVMLAENRLMLELARSLGEVRSMHRGHGTLELAVELRPDGDGGLRPLLRAVAADHLIALPAHHHRRRPPANGR